MLSFFSRIPNFIQYTFNYFSRDCLSVGRRFNLIIRHFIRLNAYNLFRVHVSILSYLEYTCIYARSMLVLFFTFLVIIPSRNTRFIVEVVIAISL